MDLSILSEHLNTFCIFSECFPKKILLMCIFSGSSESSYFTDNLSILFKVLIALYFISSELFSICLITNCISSFVFLYILSTFRCFSVLINFHKFFTSELKIFCVFSVNLFQCWELSVNSTTYFLFSSYDLIF